jgi:cobalt-zinc-cadmium efflux system membrane fusion protein
MVIVASGLTGGETIAAANSFTLKSALGASEAGHED